MVADETVLILQMVHMQSYSCNPH